MKAKRKRRMSRRRREQIYIAVMVLLAIAVSIGLTRSIMRDDKEFEEFEQQSQEFDARMQRIDEKREASGQNAMLEQVRTWQQEQDTEPDKYAVFDTMSAEWGGDTGGIKSDRWLFSGKDAGIYILRLQAVRGQIRPCGRSD